MRHPGLSVAALWVTALVLHPAIAENSIPAIHPQKCDVGPLIKTYGLTQWLLYSCDDNGTIVIVTAPGSPAMPFVFTFLMQENGYQLYGEGTGLKEATMAAYNELKVLSEIEIRALIEQTKQSRKRIEPGKTPVN